MPSASGGGTAIAAGVWAWSLHASPVAGCAAEDEPAATADEFGSPVGCDLSRYTLREYQLPGAGAQVRMLEGRFVFADGAGVCTWPAAHCMLSFLGPTGLRDESEAPTPPGPPSRISSKPWHGRRVIELGCGCGLVSLALAHWGATVVGIDSNRAALTLAAANAARNLEDGARPHFLDVDWNDRRACASLREKFGPFDAIVVSDGVLVAPPSGAMWRFECGDDMVSPPGPLLDATAALGGGDTEVILAVVDRASDVAETARELLDRRHFLELVSPPRRVCAGASAVAMVFHFRWTQEAGLGGEVVRKLWSAM